LLLQLAKTKSKAEKTVIFFIAAFTAIVSISLPTCIPNRV
jgi:hypothetical protein